MSRAIKAMRRHPLGEPLDALVRWRDRLMTGAQPTWDELRQLSRDVDRANAIVSGAADLHQAAPPVPGSSAAYLAEQIVEDAAQLVLDVSRAYRTHSAAMCRTGEAALDQIRRDIAALKALDRGDPAFAVLAADVQNRLDNRITRRGHAVTTMGRISV